MRMWKVDPRIMCRQHLLGEHCEMHMMVGTINHNKSIQGYIDRGVMETSHIQRRHDELAKELEMRGYNHKTPMNYQDKLNLGHVNESWSLNVLINRCEVCRKRYEELK